MSDCGSEWIKVVVELLCYVRSGAVYENARQGHPTVPHPTDGSGAVGSSHHRRDGGADVAREIRQAWRE